MIYIQNQGVVSGGLFGWPMIEGIPIVLKGKHFPCFTAIQAIVSTLIHAFSVLKRYM